MRYFARRLIYLLAVLFAVTFGVSAMLDLLPGDAAVAILGDNATPEQLVQTRHELHLDEPVWERYVEWVGNAVHGDFGRSYNTNQTVGAAILQRLPVTLELVIAAQLLALTYALVAATYAARRPGKLFDNASGMVSLAMISTPHFILGLGLILIVSVKLQLLPVAGYTAISQDLTDNLRSLLLPVIAIAAEPAGVYQRLLRTELRRTLSENYILMARSKGLSPARVLFRHALRPSTFSLTTVAGLTTARLIGGSVIVETIFALPGIGRLIFDAIGSRDFVMVQGVVAVVAVGYVVVNSAVDMLYGFLDPRIRSGSH